MSRRRLLTIAQERELQKFLDPLKEDPTWKTDYILGVLFIYYLSAGNGRFGSCPIFDICHPSMYFSPERTWIESPHQRRIYLMAEHDVALSEVEEGIRIYEEKYGFKPQIGIVSSEGSGNFGVLLNGEF